MPTEEWKKEHQDKMRKYRRDYYQRNKASEKRRMRERMRELRTWLNDYKTTLQCSKCTENHPACIDFHHRDPNEKEVNISQIVKKKGWCKDRIMEEIKKCDVLCANCHRKLHYEQGDGV